MTPLKINTRAKSSSPPAVIHHRYNRIAAVFIALFCCCFWSPSARSAARPLMMTSSPTPTPSSTMPVTTLSNNEAIVIIANDDDDQTDNKRQRREIGLESLHFTDDQALKIVCDPPSPDALLRILGPAFNARYMAIEEPPEDINNNSGKSSPTPTTFNGDEIEDAVGIETDASYTAAQQGRVIDQRNLKPLDFVVDPDHEEFQPEHGLFNVEVQRALENATMMRKKRENAQELWKSLRRNNYERFTPKRLSNNGGPKGPHGGAGAGGDGPGGSKSSFTTSGSLPTPPWHCPSKVVWQNLGPAYFPQFIRTIQCGRPGSQGPTSCWFGAYECAASSFTMKILHRRSDFCYPVVEGNRTVRFEQKWTFVERAVPFCCSCQFKLFGGKPKSSNNNNKAPTMMTPRLPIKK